MDKVKAYYEAKTDFELSNILKTIEDTLHNMGHCERHKSLRISLRKRQNIIMDIQDTRWEK